MSNNGEALIGPDDFVATHESQRGSRPTAIHRSGELYNPDSVYSPSEYNAIVQFKERASNGQAVLEFFGCTSDGVEYKATLQADEVKEACENVDLDTMLREHFTMLSESGRLATREEVQRFREVNNVAFREDGPLPDDSDYFGTAAGGNQPQFSTSREFLPLGNAPFNRQLYLHDQWDMQAKAFYARTHDPIAKRALEIISDFCLGRGVRIICSSPKVQTFYDHFNKVNKLEEMLPIWTEDFFGDGEAFFRFPSSDPVDAMVEGTEEIPEFFAVDPSSIWEVVTDPENINNVKFYWQQYETPYQLVGSMPLLTDDELAPVDMSDRVDTFKYVIRYIPASEMLHFKINASAVEKRGRSDLFPLLGWFKRLRDYYDAETVKALMQAAMVFDITLTGGAIDAAAVTAFSGQVPPPDLKSPGSAFYHNEGVKVNVLESKTVSTTSGGIGIGDGLLGIIAVGMGFAKDYFGVTSRGSRATALVSTEPSAKHFERRQRVIKSMLETIIQKGIDIALANGALPAVEAVPAPNAKKQLLQKVSSAILTGGFTQALQIIHAAILGTEMQPLDRTVRILFPDIVKADRQALIADAKNAEAMNYFSKRRAAELVAASFDAEDYDYDAEQQEIQSEGKQAIAKDSEQVEKGIPDSTEPAFAPGSVVNPAVSPASASSTPSSSTPPTPTPKTSKTSKTSTPSTPSKTGASHGADNPAGKGGNAIRDDLGVHAREGKRRAIFRFQISQGTLKE